MLVGKYAVEHEKFLAKRVLMRGKGAGGRIADERGRARDFAADAVEQAAFDAGLREAESRACHRLRSRHALGEIGVDEFV